MGATINFGSTNTLALAEYFIQKFNLVGRDAEYSKNRPTLAALAPSRDTEKLKQADGFKETLKLAGGFTGNPNWVEGNKYHNPSTKVRWSVGDPYAQYGYLSFDTLMLQRVMGGGALMDVKEEEADDVRDGMLDTCEFELWNDGTGARAQATAVSGTATVTATLGNGGDVYNFAYGMVVTSNTARDGTGTAHTNIYTVSDLDPQGGKVILTRTVDNSSAIAANDYIHVINSAAKYMPGIPSFIPA